MQQHTLLAAKQLLIELGPIDKENHTQASPTPAPHTETSLTAGLTMMITTTLQSHPEQCVAS